MNKHAIIIAGLCFCISPATQVQAESNANAAAPTIAVTKLDTTDKTLEVSYQIRNDSEQDIWLCEDIAVYQDEFDFEAYLAEDNQTLLIRRRLEVEVVGSMPYAQPHGRYVRLPGGQVRAESLLLPFPVYPRRVFGSGQRPTGPVNAQHLAIEIGYSTGDLPGMIFGMLEEAEKSGQMRSASRPMQRPTAIDWFVGGLWRFNKMSEYLRDRNEEIVLPWTDGPLNVEQVLRTVVKGQRIPYEEKYDPPLMSPPDLDGYTRVEIRYEPSMLGYFFPYPGERSLLSAAETKHLQSQKTVVANEQEGLKTFTEEIGKGFYGREAIITERATADVVCYRDNARLVSFTVYDDVSVVTEDKHIFRYKWGLASLKTLTPQIHPFKLRGRCAANLRDLWYRLRLQHEGQKTRTRDSSRNNKTAYSASREWCDAMVRTYEAALGNSRDKYMMRPYKCPSVDEGRSTYAMNPNCKPDAPADMVLLFETKAGWNQHGGPKLFTFDNHDPKGGCVLLNDGTVKFIRTAEELQQLRWK